MPDDPPSKQPVRWTILGSGTSAGVPVIGCDCPICRSDDPHDRRLRCSSCLETIDEAGQNRVILFDTSPDLREQALRQHLKRCDGIFYTHHHVDHLWGLDEVRRFNMLMREAINIYAEDHTMENIFRVYPHIFESQNNVNASFVATLVPNRIKVGQTIELYGLRIEAIRFMHGRLPILGFRIDRVDASDGYEPDSENMADNNDDPLPLAYCTDVSAIPPETWPRLTGLKTLVLDMLRPRHHPTHFNVDQAIETAREIGASQTYFIHMTHNVLHAELELKLPPGMNLAYDGLALGSNPDDVVGK